MSNNDKVADQLLTAGQVADLLQLHERTVQRYAHDGTIPAHRIGKGIRARYRFRRSDIDEYLAAQSNQVHEPRTEDQAGVR